MLDPTREHSTFINSLIGLLKTKSEILKNTDEKSTGNKIKDSDKAKYDVTKEILKFCNQNTVGSDFPIPTPLYGPLPDAGTLLPPQTGPLKTTYPQDFKDPGDGRASGRVQTNV